ncbi:hypothetical protein IU500_21705 [Nocardia terpenica]|uniref:Iron reductase n=1 Tax=Nocardia terpenica TaxID=455432 RepID=A0A164M7G3_9NOCA|nr:hypothetical protein [Nocardia terpenica]ATL67598.1 hypothetical protein CRH09_16735 [Nocardia terpenica]KZM73112.1 hypothetical protein AWN90_30865 [Nocardia terpenica]MBF6064321.1 hypothetical protein [Nocardia terpenica]MBF6106654.1 hypothetical protein [Nocardia terpenica]MBF6113939.1 hypothetical protein [Nocardia terpenica]
MYEPMTARPTTRSEAVFGRACARLRSLQPEHPRVYAVAAIAEQARRRWWRLADGNREGRIELMYHRHAAEMISADIAAEVVATALVHGVIGRVTALLVAEGRAWDPGLENLWLHTDNDGGVDWAGLSDTTIRVVDGDAAAGEPGVVALPCERAMFVWLAHRCDASLTMVQQSLARHAGLDPGRFWELVGEAVMGAATYVPDLAGTSPEVGARRGEGLLTALQERGLPVRRTTCLGHRTRRVANRLVLVQSR